MFTDIFKPAWQSTNPNRRRKGIARLNPEITAEADTLYALASEDPEQSIRLAAIERIKLITLLVRLLKNAPTSLEQDKLGRMVTSAAISEVQNIQGSLKAVELIDMDDDLIRIAFDAKITEVQLAAADKIEHCYHLLKLASEHPLSKLRLSAAQRIEATDSLQTLFNASKGKDKSVWRVAKEKLDLIRQSDQERASQQNKADTLFIDLKNLSTLAVDPLFKQKWLLLLDRWHQIPNPQKEHLTDEFAAITQATQVKIEAFDQKLAVEKSNEDPTEDARLDQAEAIKLILESLDILNELPAEQIDIPSLRATLTTQKSRWESACETLQPNETQESQFNEKTKALQDGLAGLYSLRKKADEIEALNQVLSTTAADDLATNMDLYRQARNIKKNIEWPKNVAEPKDLRTLRKDLELLEERKNRQADIIQSINESIAQEITQLTDSIEQGKLNESGRSAQNISKLVNKLPNKDADEVHQQIKPLMNQLAELRDWQAFAAQPKKEALVASMEALANELDNPSDPTVRLEYIQRLQTEWKQLGRLPNPTEQQLWDRFQKASKTAFEPCRENFIEQADTREFNKQQRETMCSQLQDYLDNYNWSQADWRSVQETVKLARVEWKQYQPVDRKYHRDLEDKFYTILHSINEKLDTYKQTNYRLKTKVLEQAKPLLDKEDVESTTLEIKALRDQWRNIGMLPAEHYKAMNNEFHAIFDQIMNRKQKLWSDITAQKKHNAQAIEEKIQVLRDIVDESNNQKIFEYRKEINHLDSLFTEYQPLLAADNKQLQKSIDTLKKQFDKSLQLAENEKHLNEFDAVQQRALIVIELENQVLNQSLTTGIMQELTERWNNVPEPNNTASTRLNARFDAAVHAFDQNKLNILQNSIEQAERYAQEVCILAEITAEVDSPASDTDQRMQLQVNRLNQSLQNKQQASHMELNEFQQLELEWYITGPLSHKVRLPLEKRFEIARQSYLSKAT